MRMGSLRGAGLVASLVITGGIWLYAHGGGGATGSSAPAYCHDVARLAAVLTDVRQSGDAAGQATALASIQSSITADAAASGPIPAAALTRVGSDVGDWRTAIGSGDAVEQTIALDRILSDLAAVPGC